MNQSVDPARITAPEPNNWFFIVAILLPGEIGGQAEEDAAKYLSECNVGASSKPVVAYIAGVTAPAGRRMGHAGAIISGGKGKAADKIKALSEAGVTIAERMTLLGETLHKIMKKSRIIWNPMLINVLSTYLGTLFCLS